MAFAETLAPKHVLPIVEEAAKEDAKAAVKEVAKVAAKLDAITLAMEIADNH